jgi:hypothetical protein
MRNKYYLLRAFSKARLKILGLFLCISHFSLVSCSDADVMCFTKSRDYIYYNQTKELSLQLGSNYQNSCKISSSDESIVQVVNGKSVKGISVGSVTITVTGKDNVSQTCTIVVLPMETVYEEPVLDFGSDTTDFLEKEKRQLSTDQDNVLEYNGNTIFGSYKLDYFFQGGKFTGSQYVMNYCHTLEASIKVFLKERYEYIGNVNNVVALFKDRKKGYYVGVSISMSSEKMFIFYTDQDGLNEALKKV